MLVLRFAGCLAGFFVPVCVAGAVLCLCACFKGLQVLGVCCVWCHCVRLSVGVCAVPVVRPAALSVCCVAGFALCGAVGVCRCCAGCAHEGCALWCCVCAFFNKNKGLQRF